MKYLMTTISGGTRIRADHNVFAGVLASVAANTVVSGDEVWIAPADGSNVKAGDKWLKVTHAGVTGWMAFTHMGLPISKDWKEIDVTVPPPAADDIIDGYLRTATGRIIKMVVVE